MDKYHLDKPGKKPYTAEKIESIIVEINDAKLTLVPTYYVNNFIICPNVLYSVLPVLRKLL